MFGLRKVPFNDLFQVVQPGEQVELVEADGVTCMALLTDDPALRERLIQALNEQSDPYRDWGLKDSAGNMVKPSTEVLEAKQELLGELSHHGIKHVSADYYGSGDEGYVNGVALSPEMDDQGRVLGSEIQAKLEQDVDNFITQVTDSLGLDWWNNEGGGGTLTIDVEAAKVHFQHYQHTEEAIDLPFSV